MSRVPDFEALSEEVLRQHRGEKWQRYPGDVLPAWVAELDYPIAEPIQEAVREALAHHDFGYPLDPRATELPEVFCDRMTERFGWTPEIDLVDALSDVVQGVYLALDAYSEAGDGVLIQTPIYPPFLRAVDETRRRLVSNPLVSNGTRYELDLDGVRAAPENTRILLLCNPHNPSGRVLEQGELAALAELAASRDWVIVSDEIHADLVYPGSRHIPIASLGPDVAARTVTLTSATKSFNIPGLRCAVAAFGTRELRERFNRRPTHERGGLGSLGIAATVAAWRDSDAWLEAVLRTLAERRDQLGKRLARDFPAVGYHSPEASYLGWLDFRGLALDPSPYRFFLERARVALSAGEIFGEPGRGFARLNFGTTAALLDEILDRLAAALPDPS